MDKDEALRIALEALVDFGWHIETCPQFPTWAESKKHPPCTCGYDTAITALRQALEQPGIVPSDYSKQSPVQPEQKPVAYLYHDTACAELANPLAGSTLLVLACDRKPNGRNETPLYTAPPKREWVGLTDEEEIELDEKYGDDFNAYIDARDAKLKEKNGF